MGAAAGTRFLGFALEGGEISDGLSWPEGLVQLIAGYPAVSQGARPSSSRSPCSGQW